MSTRDELILSAGLCWLFETEQPADAIIQHHGTTLRDDENNRLFCFVPEGWSGHPVVAVDVAKVDWIDNGPNQLSTPGNPLKPDELDNLAARLTALGYEVFDTWNGHPGISGSIALKQTAHPTLLAAVNRYRAGCPEHPNRHVFCDCGWYARGNERVVFPAELTGGVR